MHATRPNRTTSSEKELAKDLEQLELNPVSYVTSDQLDTLIKTFDKKLSNLKQSVVVDFGKITNRVDGHGRVLVRIQRLKPRLVPKRLMRQLGTLQGSNVFGDEIKDATADPYRTDDRRLKTKTLKAIQWYIRENDLTLSAINSFPQITFGTSDGQEQSVYIEEIMTDFEARDRTKRGA